MAIYDYSGKVIYSNSIAPNNDQIAIDKAITPGVYFISISSNTENKTIKALIN